MDVHFENITLVTVWSKYGNEEQEKWGDPLGGGLVYDNVRGVAEQ